MGKSIFKSRLRQTGNEKPVCISLILSGFCETKPITTHAARSECGSRLPARVIKLHKRSDGRNEERKRRERRGQGLRRASGSGRREGLRFFDLVGYRSAFF